MRYLTKKIIIGLIYIGVTTSVYAEIPFNSVYVLTEKQDGDDENCNADPSVIADTIKSTLRYNRINISQSTTDADVLLYMHHNVIKTSGDHCSYNIRIQLFKFGEINLPKKQLFGSHLICLKSTIGHWRKNVLQSRMNEVSRQMTDGCISEAEKQ